jgi:hypothetical protein
MARHCGSPGLTVAAESGISGEYQEKAWKIHEDSSNIWEGTVSGGASDILEDLAGCVLATVMIFGAILGFILVAIFVNIYSAAIFLAIYFGVIFVATKFPTQLRRWRSREAGSRKAKP